MKTRNGFVSNSSSSSFIIVVDGKQNDLLKKFSEAVKETGCEGGGVSKMSLKEFFAHYTEDYEWQDDDVKAENAATCEKVKLLVKEGKMEIWNIDCDREACELVGFIVNNLLRCEVIEENVG